jgi:hypothetical protein
MENGENIPLWNAHGREPRQIPLGKYQPVFDFIGLTKGFWLKSRLCCGVSSHGNRPMKLTLPIESG